MYMVLPLAKPNSLSAAAPIIIIPIILSISGGRGGFLAVFFLQPTGNVGEATSITFLAVAMLRFPQIKV